MSRLIDQAGLTAGSGLNAGAGLYKWPSFNPFDPLDLDPYLLFDAESSMRGTLEAPTLDLDPRNQETLAVITAVRTGVATYTDASGVIQSANADTVRVDHVDGVPMILVEPSATNLVEYSEDFSNSYWTKSGTSSVTSNTTISPDGTVNADTISNATGTSTGDTVFRTINPTDVDHTFSAYVKSAGATTMSLYMRNGITGIILSQVISLTDEWQRVTLTHNIQNGQIIFGNSDGDFAVWGAQLETGSVATSYIPTSGGNEAARTRAADDLVITGSAFSDFYNQSEGTFYVESVPNENTVSSFLFDLTKISGESERLLVYNTAGSQKVYLSTASTTWVDKIIGVRPAAGALSRGAISYETNNVEASLDGVNMVPDTSATMSTSIAKMTIGNRFENSFYFGGHIKRLIYWPTSSDRL